MRKFVLDKKLTNIWTEREVKKANRELHNQTSRMDNLQKIEHLSKRCSDLLSEMKRHERESIKNKKRGDQLQKEKDQSRTELSKTVGLKEKLEKLCRELQKENNKLKVHLIFPFHKSIEIGANDSWGRTRTRRSRTARLEIKAPGTRSMRRYCRNSMTTKKRKTIRENRLSTWI